jgi:hypothetical protein
MEKTEIVTDEKIILLLGALYYFDLWQRGIKKIGV